MALFQIDYYSQAMEQTMGVCVIIPENKWGYSLADRPEGYRYPTLWLFCGGGYDHTDWLRYTALELYAAQHGLAVVLPGISYCGYVNTAEGDAAGLQLGLVNVADHLYGCQLGLVNVVMDRDWTVWPFINIGW